MPSRAAPAALRGAAYENEEGLGGVGDAPGTGYGLVPTLIEQASPVSKSSPKT